MPTFVEIRTLNIFFISGPIQIIVEYASRGDLRMLLKNSHTVEDSVVEKSECVPNTLRISDLMVFAYQVASGMKYLASKQVLLINRSGQSGYFGP